MAREEQGRRKGLLSAGLASPLPPLIVTPHLLLPSSLPVSAVAQRLPGGPGASLVLLWKAAGLTRVPLTLDGLPAPHEQCRSRPSLP